MIIDDGLGEDVGLNDVVIVGAPKVGICRHGGAEAGWAEEIEGVFGLWEKLAPKVKWELLVGSA